MDPASAGGFGLALLIAALVLGLRHGIDWDHIAAITDISASQDSRRSAVAFGSLYVAGHAGVVFLLGVIAIAVGARIPQGVETVMGRIVGLTLIAMAVYVGYSLLQRDQEFRLRSRWMIVLSAARRSYLAVRRALLSRSEATITHEHPHTAVRSFHHSPQGEHEAPSGEVRVHSHAHAHDEPFGTYTTRSSVGVGMLHGIGAETPTQVIVFLAAANAGGIAAGITVLIVFVIGLILSNTAITVASSFGFLAATGNRVVYTAMAGFVGVVSLIMGVLFLFGQDSLLPAFFAG